jgi:soluble cytochrome b562
MTTVNKAQADALDSLRKAFAEAAHAINDEGWSALDCLSDYTDFPDSINDVIKALDDMEEN